MGAITKNVLNTSTKKVSMSQPKVTYCANCGKPKPITVTSPQAAPRGAEVRPSADALYLMKQLQEQLRAGPMAPEPPLLVPMKKRSPALSTRQQQGERRMAPEPPSLWPIEE
jgi:hypothetical protein